jgi:hypothetical protein
MAVLTRIAPRSSRASEAKPLPDAPPLPPDASSGKRWRFRRNLVIYVAHRAGLSQRLLADVFDLPRSHIGSIIRDLEKYESR